MSNLPKVPNDLAVIDVAPKNQADPRVPMAEQFALGSEIAIGLFRRANGQIGWLHKPVIFITQPRQLNIDGIARLPGYPSDINVSGSVIVPPLQSASSVVRQDQYLSLVGLTVDVGAEHDDSLNVSFQYRNPTNSTQILNTTKENARRYRAFWVLILSPEELTSDTVINALPLLDNERRLMINQVNPTGFTLESLRIYALDPNWVQGKAYTVHPEYIDIAPICIVRRMQNYLDRGYTFGLNGEEPLDLLYNVLPNHKLLHILNFDAFLKERITDIFAGRPGVGSAYRRTVQNLTSGAVAGNPGASGEAAGSPDGSVCLANDQRSGFSNEARIRKWSAHTVVASNDGTGRAVVAIALNTNSPIGTRFSENAADHKIFASDGSEQSGFGSFSSLGSNAALSWVTTGNVITPGSTVYVVPGVLYPGGSGFSIPFVEVEKVWRNGVALSPENVRLGAQDLSAYEAPANNEEFIVVLGRERQALHYIYRHVFVTTNANGVATIPNNERGIFAFIQGVSGPINAPVKTGLTPNTNYPALVFYPPRSLESWQFQFRYPDYQGLSDRSWVDGARIVSTTFLYAHTQGGGGSVFQSPEPLRYAPISSHLPYVEDIGIPAYQLNMPIQLAGESGVGPGAVFRHELPGTLLLSAPGLALPSLGEILTVQGGAVVQGRSIQGKLFANDQPMGFRTPVLANNAAYQMVVCFALEKNNEQRLMIITCVTQGGENIEINSDTGTAFDVFRI